MKKAFSIDEKTRGFYEPGVRMEEDTIIISEDDKKPEIFIQAVLMDRIDKILHYASLLINTFNK